MYARLGMHMGTCVSVLTFRQEIGGLALTDGRRDIIKVSDSVLLTNQPRERGRPQLQSHDSRVADPILNRF